MMGVLQIMLCNAPIFHSIVPAAAGRLLGEGAVGEAD
jgi:hypothetical protein